MGLRRAAIVVCACVAARARASPLFADGLDGGDPLAPELDELDELDELVGGDADVYGCRASAGYAWCASRGACVRAWETPCPVEFAEEDSRSKENDSKEGEAEEEEEETRDEDEEAERAIKLNIIVLTVSVLVAIAQAFEFGHEHLLEHTSETMRPIIEGLFAELTLLGFIGLTLFLVFKMEWLKVISDKFYGDEKVIPELGEAVHMVLFFVMVLFLAQAVILARLGDRILERWRAWESRSLESLSPEAIVDCRELRTKGTLYLAFFARDKPSVQLLLHSLTRERFKEVHGLNPADFEFAAYLGVALGKTLAEIVEVPVKTWMLLEVALLVFWRLDAVANANARLGGWIMFGYCLPVIACVTHGKLRRILLEHAGPLLRSAEERGGNVGLLQQTKCLAPRRQASQKRLSGASARRRSTTSPRRPSETSSQAASDTTATGATPPRNKPSPRKSRKQVSFPTFPSHQSSPERGPPPPPPHSSESPSSPMSPRRRLPRFPSPLAWFRKKRPGAPPAAENDGLLRAARRGDRYESLELSGGPPSAEGDGLLGRATAAVDAFFTGSSRAPRHRRVSTRLEEMAKAGVDKDYHTQFWFGDHHKAHYTLDVLRLVPLGVAIYTAVLWLYHAPSLISGEVLSSHPLGVRLCVLAVAVVPPQLSFAVLASVVRDFAIAANVESLQNLRFVEHVIRRQRTVAAFEALKVVTFLRKPDVVATVLEKAGGDGIDSRHKQAMGRALVEGEGSEERRERIEVARAEDERQERSWKAIFDVFDGDGQGSIDHDELRELLEKFCSDGTDESQITKIIGLLDDDASGEVDFEEFYNFGCALEHHITLHCDPQELLRDMFEIIDDDKGGLITVQELHATIRGIGQELSIDDVYNLIRDIDDDGNGALDIHEFHLLLNRVGCDFLGEAKKRKGGHH